MNPEQPMITCVMVNDPTKTPPTKLTNYHVNRIQVNCCSSSEANDLTNSSPNSLSNGTSSPASSDSSASSRLFFVDKLNCAQPTFSKKLNQQTPANKPTTDLEKNRHQNALNVQIMKSSQKAVKNDLTGTKFSIPTSSPTPKSIYSEQSLKKQIHQFKERQLQNQLHYYSSTSTSSSTSSTSSSQFLHNKQLIGKHLSDRHKKDKRSADKPTADKHLSESEPLSSFNYSLNSNCSTTDTLLTNATIRSTGNDETANAQQSTVNCSSNDDHCDSSATTKTTKTDHSTGTNETKQQQFCKNNTSNSQTSHSEPGKGTLNEHYLFSIKRPTELKHYTHEIKFMKTPGWTLLTSILIFIAILVISLLFTVGVYISGSKSLLI